MEAAQAFSRRHLTLALGIGATTAVYSVVNGVLLKPLPFPDSDRLVTLYHVTPASHKDLQGAASYFTYRDHPLIAGRTITWTDIHQLRPLAVITENLALEYWDTPAKAIGHRIRSFPNEPWQEIVGVVGNLRAEGLNHPPPPLVFVPGGITV